MSSKQTLFTILHNSDQKPVNNSVKFVSTLALQYHEKCCHFPLNKGKIAKFQTSGGNKIV